ncbi:calcium-binding protein [Massilia sp. YMA4]|uniref:calcium-binding protein n=1 Tax=Massilia sp. YMA4 TaxID=1593482 RepID=UPI001877B5C8|nr:calcium-binding protein [Massilia sp. YMA4]
MDIFWQGGDAIAVTAGYHWAHKGINPFDYYDAETTSFIGGADIYVEFVIKNFHNGDLGLTLGNFGISKGWSPDRSGENYNGTAADNSLIGGDGNDTIAGGAGADFLEGGEGIDTYVFARGDGADSIASARSGNEDILELGIGIAQSDVAFTRDGDNIILTFNGGGDSITFLSSGVTGLSPVGGLHFSDGVIWDAARISAEAQLIILGTDANDYLVGNGAPNIFRAGGGHDRLEGMSGGDTYLFNAGDGNDIIDDFGSDGVDVLRFGEGIAQGDVSVHRSGDDSVIEIANGKGQITIVGGGTVDGFHIERIEFADGSLLNIKAVLSELAFIGSDGNDTLTGDSGDNVFIGHGGDDILSGMEGSDVYLFSPGDGNDSIYDSSEIGTDIIRFSAGVLPSDLIAQRSTYGNLVLSVTGTDDSITVLQWSNSKINHIEQVEFADGTIWDENDITSLAIVGSDESDEVVGDKWDNALQGGKGNDRLYGLDGSDTYIFRSGDGRDIIFDKGPSGVDVLELGEGLNPSHLDIKVRGRDLIFSFNEGADSITIEGYLNASEENRIEIIRFADGTVWSTATIAEKIAGLQFAGTDGDDTVRGTADDNVLSGGKGDDRLEGSTGSDTYSFERGDGADTISEWGYGSNDVDTIRFGAGITAADIVLSRSGENVVFALAGSDDSITVTSWNSSYYRVERIEFADGQAWDAATLAEKIAALPLVGTASDDSLRGDDGANAFNGGRGNDQLAGGQGSDTYVFERGDGLDTIFELDFNGADVDTIMFGAGIAASDIMLSRSGDDIALAIVGTEDSVKISNWNSGVDYRIERVEFADGSAWDAATLKAKVAALPFVGSDGDDRLVGNDGANVFQGNKGNDLFTGWGGSDTYVFSRGDGKDTISEYSYSSDDIDTIRFGTGISASDVMLSRSGDDIVLAIAGTEDSVKISNWSSGVDYRIERVEFADGSAWDAATLKAKVAALPFVGSDGDDRLVGNDGANVFQGNKGNDLFTGWGGSDTYVFVRGDGRDTISEYSYSSDDIDTIRFGTGISASDVVLSRSGDDVVLAIAGTEDSVKISNWNSGVDYRIERVEFADGSAWDAATLKAKVAALPFVGSDGDDRLVGNDGANVFQGNKGNDLFTGWGGSDTYVFARGDGKDTISEYSYSSDDIDTIRFGTGISASDVVLSRSGDDVVLAIAGTEDSVKISNWSSGVDYRIERVEFADGSAWDAATLKAKVAALPFVGSDGDDRLVGNDGANVFQGNKGNDLFTGWGGSDTYVFARGDGRDTISEYSYSSDDIDTIRFGTGISASDVVLSRSGDDVVLAIAGTEDSVKISNWNSGVDYRIERIEFADGSAWDAATLKAKVAALPFVGSDGDDRLVGNDGANVFQGNKGNDLFTGWGGSDTYVFSRGDGKDTISEYSYSSDDIDTIRFGTGISASDVMLSRSGDDIVLAIAGTEDSVKISNWSSGVDYRIERVEFADGSAWDAATLKAKVAALPFVGSDGDDSLVGNDGANVFQGNKGNDLFTGWGGSDTYVFARGDGRDTISEYSYSSDDIDTIRFGTGISASDVVLSRSGDDVVLAIAGTEDSVKISNWNSGVDYRIERIEFADGSAWDAATLKAKVAALPFVGSDGDDRLVGNDGANVFQGNKGNDLFTGWGGSDTYVFARGDGRDTISEYSYSSDDIDTIRFGTGISASDVVLSRSGDDVVLAIAGTEDSVKISNWNSGVDYRIERIEFADGSAWDAATLKAKVAALPFVGSDGNDRLVGNDGANVFQGNKGNDLFTGWGGSDTYVFARGDGKDTISEYSYSSDDIDTIRFGTGISASDVVLSRSGDDVVLAIAGTEDSVKISNWNSGVDYRIERIEFADGSAWDAATLKAKVAALPFVGSDGDDRLVGNDGANVFQGNKGNDLFTGWGGSDTYVFARGDGKDTISEYSYSSDDIDTIRFGTGISASDVVLSRSGDDVLLAITGTEDTIRIINWSSASNYRIEQMEFADGTVWDVDGMSLVLLVGANSTVER